MKLKKITIQTLLNFVFYTVTLTLFSLTIVCVLNDSIRESLREKLTSHQRQVLSTATGNLLHNGQKIKVVKIRKDNEFFLEIYGHAIHSQASPLLISRIPLSFGRDAYINFKGVSSNLALHDVDGDNKLEILVPGYEKNLLARLNIYKYDENEHIFKLTHLPTNQIP